MERYTLYFDPNARVNDLGHRHLVIQPPVQKALQEALSELPHTTISTGEARTVVTHTWPVTPGSEILTGVRQAIHEAGHSDEVIGPLPNGLNFQQYREFIAKQQI